jgi:hypothetical protein
MRDKLDGLIIRWKRGRSSEVGVELEKIVFPLRNLASKASLHQVAAAEATICSPITIGKALYRVGVIGPP